MSTPLQWRKSILKRHSSTPEASGTTELWARPSLYGTLVLCWVLSHHCDTWCWASVETGWWSSSPQTSFIYDFSWGGKEVLIRAIWGQSGEKPVDFFCLLLSMNSWTVFAWNCSHSSFPSRADISNLCAWLADNINNYSSSKKPQSHAF